MQYLGLYENAEHCQLANTRTINGRTVLTTGQVAEICHVAPRTVSKWFDAGHLGGYRIPGSRDRRIPAEQLLAFMQAHGMPADALDGGTCRILIVDQSDEAPRVANELSDSDRYAVRLAGTEFEAGVVAQQFDPHVIAVSIGRDINQAALVAQNMRATAILQSSKLIAITDDLTDAVHNALLEGGFDAWVTRPYCSTALIDAVEKATDLIT